MAVPTPQLLEIISNQADELLARGHGDIDFVAQVKAELLNRIGSRDASLEEIAHSLNLSRSTLERRLSAQDTSFRKVKDEIVHQLATKALDDTNARISAIARQLGYEQLSSFSRAFTRLSGGLTPLKYRKRRSNP